MISPQTKLNVLRRDGYKCSRCKRTGDLTIDHVVPKSKGGTNHQSNLQALCRDCNLEKGNYHPTLKQRIIGFFFSRRDAHKMQEDIFNFVRLRETDLEDRITVMKQNMVMGYKADMGNLRKETIDLMAKSVEYEQLELAKKTVRFANDTARLEKKCEHLMEIVKLLANEIEEINNKNIWTKS